jgi:hypothetical protein
MNNFEVQGELGEPLGEALRIPCYKGLEPVRLTYRGFVRQIRGVLRVAMSRIPSKVVEPQLLWPSSGYRYWPSRSCSTSYRRLGTRFGTYVDAMVSV